MIRITQIEGESKQGQTKPIFCVGEDGHRYVVKGSSTGNKARICEWISGRLSRYLDLPVPPFEMMELDPRLLHYGVTEYADRIGSGIAFGSQRVSNTIEILYSQIQRIPSDLRARVLLFDWWIANGDRILSESGGNPNLLWDVDSKALVVIDHNLAFDLPLCHDFWAGHIFKDDRKLWNATFKDEHSQKFRRAIKALPDIWNELPEEWTEVDGGVNLETVANLLWRFDRDADNFWGQP